LCHRHALAGSILAVLILAESSWAAVPIEPNAETPSAAIGILIDPDSKPGVLVDAVRVGSPADEAGITPGDRIENLDGESLEDWYAFRSAIRKGEPGVARRLTVRRAGVAFEVLVVPGIPVSGSERREQLFVPSYRTSCERGRGYMPSLGLIAVGASVFLALCLWSTAKGVSIRALLLGGGAWVIATGASLGQSLILCRLTGGWTLGLPLVGVLTENLVFLALATPFALGSRRAASGYGARSWHVTARIGALYMIGANAAALVVVVVMGSILPAMPSAHSFISAGRRALDIGTNAVRCSWLMRSWWGRLPRR